MLDTQPSDRLVLESRVGHEHILLWLVLSNVFLGALLIVILSLCASQRKSFNRELRAASVAVYGMHIHADISITNHQLILITFKTRRYIAIGTGHGDAHLRCAKYEQTQH